MRAIPLTISRADALEDLQRRVSQLEAVVSALQGRLSLRSDVSSPQVDAVTDAELLVAIAESVKGRAFTAAEVLAHATVDPALGRVVQALTPVQVGRRLRALMGREIGGVTLERLGREAGGVIWCVVSTGLHAGAGSPTWKRV